MRIRRLLLLAALCLGRFGVLCCVILWGTLVRAAGAGAGCGNHWPLCNGTVLQHSASLNTLIEFTHRITSGLSLVAVLGLLLWTFRSTVRGDLARGAAVAAVALTVMEAILGALLVALGLTAQSQSPLRPPLSGTASDQYAAAAGGADRDRALAVPPHRVSLESIRLVNPLAAVAGIFVALRWL